MRTATSRYPKKISEQRYLKDDEGVHGRGAGLAVVGAHVIVEEAEVDGACDLAEEVVLRYVLLKAYLVEELGLRKKAAHQCASLHVLYFMGQNST